MFKISALSVIMIALTACAVQPSRPNSPQIATQRSVVVLLHGLARTPSSMSQMASALESEGFRVCNLPYPSRSYSIETLARDHVLPEIEKCAAGSEAPVHIVTHSMGGLIVRQLAVSREFTRIGRVVMLSPPNHGSEVVDALGEFALFQQVNGPAGSQLGTSSTALANRLGPASFDVGIITGRRSINWFLSSLIPGADDGKVSIASARLEGMKDFLVVPSSHPFIMKDKKAIEQTIFFLKNGSFEQVPNNSFKPSPLRGLVQVLASFTCPRPQSGPA